MDLNLSPFHWVSSYRKLNDDLRTLQDSLAGLIAQKDKVSTRDKLPPSKRAPNKAPNNTHTNATVASIPYEDLLALATAFAADPQQREFLESTTFISFRLVNSIIQLSVEQIPGAASSIPTKWNGFKIQVRMVRYTLFNTKLGECLYHDLGTLGSEYYAPVLLQVNNERARFSRGMVLDLHTPGQRVSQIMVTTGHTVKKDSVCTSALKSMNRLEDPIATCFYATSQLNDLGEYVIFDKCHDYAIWDIHQPTRLDNYVVDLDMDGNDLGRRLPLTDRWGWADSDSVHYDQSGVCQIIREVDQLINEKQIVAHQGYASGPSVGFFEEEILFDYGRITASVSTNSSNLVFARPGDSGSPVWRVSDRQIIGFVLGGYGISQSGDQTTVVQLLPQVLDAFMPEYGNRRRTSLSQ